ncbi:hypothetical protein DFH11DRAFT_1588582 [Phellopilus nigrolimitatus]|nr:hypothetical protein DFH11DRAFT_1588582 [Phellopilus nigrolimitatus]
MRPLFSTSTLKTLQKARVAPTIHLWTGFRCDRRVFSHVTLSERGGLTSKYISRPTPTGATSPWSRFLSTQGGAKGKSPQEKKDGEPNSPQSGQMRAEEGKEPGPHFENLTLPVVFPGSPGGSGGSGGGGLFSITRSPLFDAALTTFIGLGMVFLGGIGYVAWYKWNVLVQMEKAFDAGYDPALELASKAKERYAHYESENQEHEIEHLRRKEQDLVDRIISGKEKGHYWLFLGSKGAGKTTMIYDAMASVAAEGIAVCDAHPDLEVFRLRLGKALNYEFNEDSQTGLFQRRDPREGGPGLDIERAMNKLEKVALRRSQKTNRPLVLVLNNVHFFQHTDEGRNMLLQLQQRAESWAESGILTMVFSTDDFWPFLVMRKSASRMQTLSIYDLEKREALHAALRLRRSYMHPQQHPHEPIEDKKTIEDVLSFVGGRLSFISKVTKTKDMVEFAEDMVKREKGWLLSQIGLIEDHDDDVMDEQKWSSCSWLLLQEFVKLHEENEQEIKESGKESDGFFLPAVTYDRARQLMTRTDFIDDLDRSNIISIDVNFMVRPDSMVILQAAKEVVNQPHFEESLQSVRDRVDEIESLHRTRELTFKDVNSGDRIRLVVDKGGAQLVDG